MNKYINLRSSIDIITPDALIRNLDSVSDDLMRRIARAAKRILAGLPAADVRDGWIPVTERLPDKNSKVICAVSDCGGYVCMGWYDGAKIEAGIEGDDVTHWMPLPELPEEIKR